MRRSIAVADSETDPFRRNRVPKPYVWGFYDGVDYLQFDGDGDIVAATVDFVDFIRDKPIIIYAHNAGRFDWHFLLPYANEYSDVTIINGRIAKMFIGVCELRDSWNIIPVKLAAYKKDEIDYAIMEAEERYKPENWAKISKYLESDCIYLFELVSRFIESYGLQLTQASAAMAQWKKVSKRPIPKSDKDFYDEISPYYYGGRVQCFESGIVDSLFTVYDINSAYPFAMRSCHPYSVDYHQIDGYVAGADFYKVKCRSMGAFPLRGSGGVGDRDYGLHFPCDAETHTFTITHWELDAAKETGTISHVKILESIVFAEHIDFTEYIDYFYDLRLKAKAEKDTAMDIFCKLFMNGLYGKFAANPENYSNYMICPMDVIGGLERSGWNFAGEFGPWALAEQPLSDEEQRYYNIATSASITGFVRAMLWRAICSCEGVLYCDTDSIAVRKKGSAVTLGDDLGQWKSEGDFDRAGIAGKKLYIFRGVPGTDSCGRMYKVASKGAKLTHAQLWAVARGQDVTYTFEAPTFSPQKPPSFTTRRLRFTA